MALSEKFKRGLTIAFLVILVIGFVVPGFLNFDQTETQTITEPRLCQTDADCYLACDETSIKVLCFQNLCKQNACNELKYFSYQEPPFAFSLIIEIAGETVPLENRNNEKNLFVKFKSDKTEVFSKTLSLQQILEKAAMAYQSQSKENCLEFDGKKYCTDATHQLKLMVDGHEVFSFPESYVPKKGDVVSLTYK